MLNMARERERMVDRQVERRGVHDTLVLDAMREVPREAFVAKEMAEFAYEDSPLPIEAGQIISQPYIVGLMIAAAKVRPGDNVLEIGAGSGYAAAVISRIAGRVHAIERHGMLSKLAAERLKRLGYDNVAIHTGDGTKGWPEAAPFDAILVAAGGPVIPQALKQQLGIGGQLVIPVGDLQGEQRLVKVTRTSASSFEEEDLGEVRFVPLIGEHGGGEADAPARSAHAPKTDRDNPVSALLCAAAETLPDFDYPAFGASRPVCRRAERCLSQNAPMPGMVGRRRTRP